MIDLIFIEWFSQDSRLPAEFEITGFCHPCGSEEGNCLAVQVMRWSDGSYLEDQDHWWLSGIHRDVLLLSKPKVWIFPSKWVLYFLFLWNYFWNLETGDEKKTNFLARYFIVCPLFSSILMIEMWWTIVPPLAKDLPPIPCLKLLCPCLTCLLYDHFLCVHQCQCDCTLTTQGGWGWIDSYLILFSY